MKNLARVVLLLFVLTALAWLPRDASAQTGRSVVVKQRDAEITLLENGDAQFVETWVVDFQRGSFTFAFREFPKNRLREMTAIRVTENDVALPTRVERGQDTIKITWNFPATNQGANFFSDVHTFTLYYTVRGAMRIYPRGDQFWWKFVERDRAYPIESARVRVHLPATFSPDQIKATTYINGGEIHGERILDGATVEFIGGPFAPQAEWEIRAQFPHSLNVPPEEWQNAEDRAAQIAAQNNLYAAVLGVTFLFGGPLLLLVLWYVFGRDRPTAFRAEFLNAPPDDTPPGVVGTLLDEHADLQDIVATVADLAQRGYIRIRESDSFGTPEYERTGKKDGDLAQFEKELLGALLRGYTVRRLDDVRGSFYYYLKDLKAALYEEVVARGFFPHSPFETRDIYFRIGKWGALLVPTFGFVAYCFLLTVAPLAFFPLLTLEIFFIGLLGLSRIMPQRTVKGAEAFAKWSAFKRYLARVEKYTDVNEAQEQFAKYLPYAIAFGLEKGWIEKFKQTATPTPKWYIPYSPAPDNWTWRDVDDVRRRDETPTRGAGDVFSPGTLASNPAAPIFSDKDAPRAPSLNEMADSSFFALNRVSSNMFDFLNTSAEAFVTKPPTRSAAQEILSGAGAVLDWVNSGAGSSSSDSSSSWSSDSSLSSSSSWSGGDSGGGGGGGGGSSGFG